MLTARLLTNCSITQRNILTPERISPVPEREYHKDTCKWEAGYFSWPILYIIGPYMLFMLLKLSWIKFSAMF
jgi:hypothetical protein